MPLTVRPGNQIQSPNVDPNRAYANRNIGNLRAVGALQAGENDLLQRVDGIIDSHPALPRSTSTSPIPSRNSRRSCSERPDASSWSSTTTPTRRPSPSPTSRVRRSHPRHASGRLDLGQRPLELGDRAARRSEHRPRRSAGRRAPSIALAPGSYRTHLTDLDVFPGSVMRARVGGIDYFFPVYGSTSVLTGRTAEANREAHRVSFDLTRNELTVATLAEARRGNYQRVAVSSDDRVG